MHLYESAFDLAYRLRLFVSADEVIRQVLGAQLGNQAVTCVPRPYFARREAVPLADGNNKTLNPKPNNARLSRSIFGGFGVLGCWDSVFVSLGSFPTAYSS